MFQVPPRRDGVVRRQTIMSNGKDLFIKGRLKTVEYCYSSVEMLKRCAIYDNNSVSHLSVVVLEELLVGDPLLLVLGVDRRTLLLDAP